MDPYELRAHRNRMRQAALARGYTARQAALQMSRNPSFNSLRDDVRLLNRIEEITERAFRVIPDPAAVVGTNGGTLPCGSLLTQFGKTEPYYCGLCSPNPTLHPPGCSAAGPR